MSAEPGIRDYVRVLARRKAVIALCTLAAAVAALVWSLFQPTRYVGRAEVLLQPRSTQSLFEPTVEKPFDPVRAMQTEMRIVTSEPVRAAVAERIGDASRATVKPVGRTDLIRISATAGDPGRAAEVANAYAAAYVDFRRTRAVDDSLSAAEQLRGRIAALDAEIGVLDQQVASAPPAGRESVRLALLPRKESLLAQQAQLRGKLDQVQVAAGIERGGAQLVTRAVPASSPISPRPLHNVLVATGFGLVIGIGLAQLRDYMDDTVKTKEDLDRVAPELPVLGMIPAVSYWSAADGPRLVSVEYPHSPAAEAYRTVRTSIRFMMLGNKLRSLQITSAGQEEGKTTTLANLGVALAGTGQRVAIVCCDLRRPSVHRFFGLSNTTGLTSVLAGDVPLSVAIQDVEGIPGLSVLASGGIPRNPSELLASKRTAEVFAKLHAEYDLVLVDSPPVLPVTDALILSNRVDGTLVVSAASITTGRALRRTLELLEQVDASVVGTLFNGVRIEATTYPYRGGAEAGEGGYKNSTLSAG